MQRWLGELLFIVGFVTFLWLVTPLENLRPRYERQPPPERPPLDFIQNEWGQSLIPHDPVRLLPPASPSDPVLGIDPSKMSASERAGTAFAIADGIWATARHVVEGCGRVFISIAGRWVPAQDVRLHAGADIAIVTAPGAAPGLPISDRPLELGQPGFHIGFPQSKPASVRSALIGRVRVKWPNFEGYERGITWAELERVPEFDGPLGGISGAPVLDERGRVVGVTISSSPRRGRVNASAVENLREIAPPQSRTPLPFAQRLGPDNFPTEAARLRSTDMISQAYCKVDPLASAPRRPRPRG